jgi:hypothetical protein
VRKLIKIGNGEDSNEKELSQSAMKKNQMRKYDQSHQWRRLKREKRIKITKGENKKSDNQNQQWRRCNRKSPIKFPN